MEVSLPLWIGLQTTSTEVEHVYVFHCSPLLTRKEWPLSWKSRKSGKKSGKVKRAKIVREKSGNPNSYLKVKVLRFLILNLIIPVSTKILYQEVREIFLRSGKSEGKSGKMKVRQKLPPSFLFSNMRGLPRVCMPSMKLN